MNSEHLKVPKELLVMIEQELRQGSYEQQELLDILSKNQTNLVEVFPEKNQCDGCQAGIPLINGCHRMGEPGGYSNSMRCQADKYKGEQE